MEGKWTQGAPLFSQIGERLRAEILRGDYPPGARIPTVRQLAEWLTVNPNTVQRALSALEGEGLVYSNGTQGRFVTEDAEVLASAREALCRDTVQAFLQSVATLGMSREDVLHIIRQEVEK